MRNMLASYSVKVLSYLAILASLLIIHKANAWQLANSLASIKTYNYKVNLIF